MDRGCDHIIAAHTTAMGVSLHMCTQTLLRDAEVSDVEARCRSIIKTRGENSEITMERIGLERLCGLMVKTPPSYVFPNQAEVSFGVGFDPDHPHL